MTITTSSALLLPPTKEKVNVFACFVCRSVSKITQKRVHGFGWNVACRQMSGYRRTYQLLSQIRVIVRMPEPDCFLGYRISAGTRLAAAATRGFKMVLFTQLSKHLCWRYMRSTESTSSCNCICLSSSCRFWDIQRQRMTWPWNMD